MRCARPCGSRWRKGWSPGSPAIPATARRSADRRPAALRHSNLISVDSPERWCNESHRLRKEERMPWGLHTKDTPGQGRILIVDDEDDVRKVLRLTLTKAGYDVVEADHGGKGIEVIGADDNALMVDVIICDIRMPKINGVEAIAFFQQQYPSVPIIVLTGYPD